MLAEAGCIEFKINVYSSSAESHFMILICSEIEKHVNKSSETKRTK